MVNNRYPYYITVITFIVACFLYAGCTTNLSKIKTKQSKNQRTAQVIDKDSNIYKAKIMLDNKHWMTANLNVNMQGSYCYDGVAINCRQYGRLYTWELAKKGCEMLGNGWRLPTDTEWEQLAAHYGGVHKDSINTGKGAYKALLHGGDSEFNALLGGSRFSGNYTRLEAHGFYWTATEKDTLTAWFYNFAKGSQNLYRQENGKKSRALSVRCIRNIGTTNNEFRN